MSKQAVEIEKILARTKPNTIDRKLAEMVRHLLAEIEQLKQGHGPTVWKCD